jgi:hypothetical protein
MMSIMHAFKAKSSAIENTDLALDTPKGKQIKCRRVVKTIYCRQALGFFGLFTFLDVDR